MCQFTSLLTEHFDYITGHVLDQYNSHSDTRIKFCRNHNIEKIPQYKLFYVLWFQAKKRHSGHTFSCVNFKKVDRFQPSDKCKERNNSVLHLKETKFVTSRESSGITPFTFQKSNKPIKNVHRKSIHNFYISYLLLYDKTPTMLSIFSINKTWLKVIFWCF